LILGENGAVVGKVMSDTLDMVKRLGWHGEAVWVFLRSVVAGGAGSWKSKERKEVLAGLKSWSEHGSAGSELGKDECGYQVVMPTREQELVNVLETTVCWIEKNWVD